MGSDLFDTVREFTAVERELDRLAGFSVRTLCLEDPQSRLHQTRYTQPALYVVNALHYYRALETGESPHFLAGHSLGEYNALLAAGAFDFLTGFRLVLHRGALMSRSPDGAMAAVIGLSAIRVTDLLRDHGLGSLDVANYNSPAQTVISGPAEAIRRAAPVCERAGAQVFVPLPVSAPFHSRYMMEASRNYTEFLQGFTFNRLRLTVISNVTGRPYPQDDPTTAVRSLLAEQMIQPVRWVQSIRQLATAGVCTFKEIGPGSVLTRLTQEIQRDRAA